MDNLQITVEKTKVKIMVYNSYGAYYNTNYSSSRYLDV